MGEDKQKVSMLSAQTAGKSLQDVCDDLSSKLFLLDPANIERVESQLAGLHERLVAVSERKQALDEAQKSDKVRKYVFPPQRVQSPGNPKMITLVIAIQETLSGISDLTDVRSCPEG